MRAALWLIALLVLGSWGLWNFHWIADDLLVIRTYTSLDEAGNLSARWSQVAADFVGPWGGNPSLTLYRPLSSVSLALDFTLFGLSPALTAYGNLLLHACSVFLIWRIGKRLLPDSRSGLYAAMLFAATPLAHENLAWAVARCGINMPLSLGATLLFLHRYERGLRGWQLQWPVLALLVAALMSYEQAIFWPLFPMVALVLGALFLEIEVEERGWNLARLFAPHLLLIPGYLLFRVIVLGSLTGGREGQLLPGSVSEAFMAPLDRLVESLIPIDESFLPDEGRNRLFWRWLCLLPVILGMMAPLHFVDPRSRRYRRALYLLLGFWLLTRLPNLNMALRPGLDSARVAYYSYPPLALLLGLLLATTRYSRFLVYVLAIAFAFNLQHRVATRCAWSEKGVQARELLFKEAERRDAIQGQGDQRFCYVNRLDGVLGSPVYQPGEMAYALYPPLVSASVRGFSLYGLVVPPPGSPPEFPAAATIADAAGGLVWINPPESQDLPPTLATQDLSPWLDPKPRASLGLAFDSKLGEGPRIRFSQDWRNDARFAQAKPVLILVAGATCLVEVLPPREPIQDDLHPLPASQAKALHNWQLRGPPNAEVAFLLELRKDPRDPNSCIARSQVVFSSVR